MANTQLTQDLLAALRRRRVARASELMQDTGVNSQPTFSRAINALGELVVAIGRTRTRRYAAAREVRGLGLALPLYRVDEAGKPGRIGTVKPIEPEGCWVEADPPLPVYLRGERKDGLFAGLPYFLADMRPQGFMGRGFFRRFPDLGLPPNPVNWSDEDALVALVRAGEDCPGELILGEPALERFYRALLVDKQTIFAGDQEHIYTERSEQAMAGTDAGSSAGGERPKFASTIEENGAHRQVLVKFSPSEETPSGRRWADLLASEHAASETLREAGLPAARSRLFRVRERTFLEVERFDRVGAAGRRPALSLANLDSEFFGRADQWRLAGERLAGRGWLSAQDALALAALQSFGRFIANTDMHFGNITLLPVNGETLTLAPAYDMLPMLYAPVNGELVQRVFEVPVPAAGCEAEWMAAGRLGAKFWQIVAADGRISDSFREIASQNAALVQRALERLG